MALRAAALRMTEFSRVPGGKSGSAIPVRYFARASDASPALFPPFHVQLAVTIPARLATASEPRPYSRAATRKLCKC